MARLEMREVPMNGMSLDAAQVPVEALVHIFPWNAAAFNFTVMRNDGL